MGVFAYLIYSGVKQGLKMPDHTVVHTDPATPIIENLSPSQYTSASAPQADWNY